MSRLSDLLDQLKRENPRLEADLKAELSSHNQRTFEVSRVLFLGICLDFHYFLGRVGFPKL